MLARTGSYILFAFWARETSNSSGQRDTRRIESISEFLGHFQRFWPRAQVTFSSGRSRRRPDRLSTTGINVAGTVRGTILVVQRSGTTLKIYVDGVLNALSRSRRCRSPPQTVVRFKLVWDGFGTNVPFAGEIDDVRIYSPPLPSMKSPTSRRGPHDRDVDAEHGGRRKAPTTSSMRGAERLAADSSGNGSNGTLTGSPTMECGRAGTDQVRRREESELRWCRRLCNFCVEQRHLWQCHVYDRGMDLLGCCCAEDPFPTRKDCDIAVAELIELMGEEKNYVDPPSVQGTFWVQVVRKYSDDVTTPNKTLCESKGLRSKAEVNELIEECIEMVPYCKYSRD